MSIEGRSSGAMSSEMKDLVDRLSKLEGLAGGGSNGRELQQHQQEMLSKLREIRAALATETGDLESVKEANEEVAKLRAIIKRKDYRILHLTRALDEASSPEQSPGSA